MKAALYLAFVICFLMTLISMVLILGFSKDGSSEANSLNGIYSSLGKAHRLAKSNYVPRIIGMAASFVLVSLLVITKDWSAWYFLFMTLYFLIYPHLVLLASKVFSMQKVVELRAMMFDAFILGVWTSLIHFSLWVSFAFLVSTVLNHIMVGGRLQLLKGIGLYVFGILIGGIFTGFRVDLNTVFYIEILAMIALLGYIYSSAGIFYKQTRRLAQIKLKLEEKNNLLNETIQELETTKNELVEKAHKAGMADIASGILHNVGNILNSVNTSASLIKETAKKSKLENLAEANSLLREHIDHIEKFIANDPKGQKLLQYYLKLEQPLKNERAKVIEHSNRLIKKIKLINDAIAAQQSYVGARMYDDEISIAKIVDDALALQAGSIQRHGIDIEKELEPVDFIEAHRSKLIHVLVNIFKNAKEAMESVEREEKKLVIRAWQDSNKVYLSITDHGEGIRKEHLNDIFKHGFTTKKEGHGFGLHSSANYITEIGGTIKVTSKGSGHGATFTIAFPRTYKGNNKHHNQEDDGH